FGAKFNTGFDYMLSSNFLISILGQYHFDITPAASSLVPQQNGGSHNYNIREKVLFIQLNVSYLIKSKSE
ncbi:MAG: hypothetical protein COA97_12285, partial [Flavobacteriales bacterium]